VIKYHPGCTPQYALSISVKALNNATNSDGLCPTLLVFGSTPPFPDVRTIFPSQRDSIRAICSARIDFERILEDRIVNSALKSTAPPAENHVLSTGEIAYVHRENMKRWIGPLKLINTYGTNALVLLDGTPREFNVAQLKPESILDPAIDTIPDARKVYITEVLSPNDPRKSLFEPAITTEINGLID
jgi:hypothetical protein